MSMHREDVERSKLFQEFDHLPEFENVTRSDIALLKAMVLDVAEKVGPHLDWVQYTFQQYTLHNVQHLLNIADHIHSFLPRITVREPPMIGLNGVELTYLWLAILLHDVGMFVSQANEKQAILDSADYQDFLRHQRDRLAVAQAAQAAGRTVTAQAIEDALFAEFIRQSHAERVHAYIRTHLKDRLRFRDIDLSTEVGNLCESHNWGVREPRDARQTDHCVQRLERQDSVGSTRVNLVYLACCLRLGDILDFDRSRTPLSAFHQVHFTEALSVQEWNKHLSIKGINVSEHRVQYVAQCTTPEDYVLVHQFLDWVDRELQECTHLVREFPQGDAERYALNLAPIVDRYQIRMANPQMVAGAFRFQLEYDRIMQLLMDKSLYPDETLFLRELLQNALDACRYQRALAQDHGMADKYIPRIQVWDYSAAPHNPGRPDEGPRIVFCDNGVGMSLHQVENYFMRVGKSFYTSPDFQAERERLAQKGIHLEACSQFGIGFLSCFLGGDRIEVATYRYGSEPLKITINGPSKYFVIERLKAPSDAQVRFNSPEDASQDTPPRYSGTKVTVFLRDGWRKNPTASPAGLVYETLDSVAVNQEMPITVVDPTSTSPRVLAETRWDHQAPRTPSWPGYYRLKPVQLVPSVFPLNRFENSLRGQGAIWFLANGGSPVLSKGDLALRRGSVGFSDALGTMSSLLLAASRKNLFSSLTKALRQLLAHPSDRFAIYARLQRQLGYPELLRYPELKESQRLALTSRDFEWALQVARKQPGRHGPWGQDLEETQALWDGDRDRLAQIWTARGTTYDNDYSIESEYRLALFGISSPGGFQTWEPAKGRAQRHSWIPAGTTVSVDAYGELAPKPEASRLYVPYERSNRVRAAVIRAFLLHARELWKAHESSEEWTNWYTSFLHAWKDYEVGNLRQHSDIRDLIMEFRKLKTKTPASAYYVVLARFHSPFGLVLHTFHEMSQPVSPEDIHLAAAVVGLDSAKIDSTVESLSEFLGWDIRKGLPSPEP